MKSHIRKLLKKNSIQSHPGIVIYIDENMMANKFYIKQKKERKKKTHSQVHLTDSLEKLVQTETRVLFFFNARG